MAKGGGNSATWGPGAKGKGQSAKGKGGKGKRDRYAREVRPATSGVAVVLPSSPGFEFEPDRTARSSANQGG